jgi:methylmalonyl-CoA mutase N-terminal domain/subunit
MADKLKRRFAEWQAHKLQPVLERFGERQSRFATNSGIEVERLYLPPLEPAAGYLDKLGFPGKYPFTRGVQPTMYRGRLWTMRQYAGFASAEESNQRYKYLLAEGQTGLSVAFDLPTQIGYDADDPIAAGEVGKVGVSISSLEDMEILLDGLPLDVVSISMTINAPAAILLAMVIAVGKKQGVSLDKLQGTVQNDILKEYIARGTYIYPPEPSLRLITDVMAYCQAEAPLWNTISISGYHIREAGSSAAQEIAFTLANGIAYVQAALAAGLQVDDFAPRLSFFFNAHNNFLEEVAKFRAARRMWARIMAERFEAKNEKSWMLRFHTQTGGSTLTAQQPLNNIVRTTWQALAAVLGGTQSLHTNAMDEALGLPTEEAVQVALRTQQLIAAESGVADTIDPLAGSYFVEALTDALEEKALAYIDKIDQLGGALAAIEQGYIQGEIQQTAYEYQLAVERGEAIVVGVNRYTVEAEVTPEILRVEESVRQRQIERLTALRARREAGAVEQALAALKAAAAGRANLMPFILTAVEAYATTGEICQALRQVWGEYQPPVSL